MPHNQQMLPDQDPGAKRHGWNIIVQARVAVMTLGRGRHYASGEQSAGHCCCRC